VKLAVRALRCGLYTGRLAGPDRLLEIWSIRGGRFVQYAGRPWLVRVRLPSVGT
jgi:hypothetical protein